MRRRSRGLAALVGVASLILLLLVFREPSSRKFLKTPDKKSSVFIAALLHNNEDILPQFIENLFVIIPHFSKVFISIYENGSDDCTKQMLGDLRRQLNEKGIANRIVTDPDKKLFNDRIEYLAILRNRVLEPFYMAAAGYTAATVINQTSQGAPYDKLIFFNDIVYDPRQFLRMFNRMGGWYDAICGLDYSYNFYDTFATRESISTMPFGGMLPAKWMPLFYSRDKQALMRQGDLIPVFSCWNGAVIMNARPFYDDETVRFRWLPILAPADDNSLRQYTASECCLIFSDFQRLGYERIYIDPLFIARYRPATFLEWIVFYWERLWSSWLYYRPHPSTSNIQRYLEIRQQARNDGLDRYDITCIQ